MGFNSAFKVLNTVETSQQIAVKHHSSFRAVIFEPCGSIRSTVRQTDMTQRVIVCRNLEIRLQAIRLGEQDRKKINF